jgi:hypothetical protein
VFPSLKEPQRLENPMDLLMLLMLLDLAPRRTPTGAFVAAQSDAANDDREGDAARRDPAGWTGPGVMQRGTPLEG